MLDLELHSTGSYFDDKDKFLQALGALTASGGGDCPEMIITGMENVFSHAFTEQSPMFVITDAGAKDFKSASNYNGMADLYHPSMNIFVSKDTGIS